MNIAYFDCFSGASGNMILGALLDAGLTTQDLETELKKLPVSGFELNVNRVQRHGISAIHVEVVTEEGHVHRHLQDIVKILEQSTLESHVKQNCIKIFTRLAEAEATVHDTTIDHIHFHEVGALDAIVDIVGAVAGLRKLGVEKIFVSPFSLGTGFTTCAHGKIPVPVPATMGLLKEKPLRYTDIEAELVTPTGAAILSTLGEPFGTPPPVQFSQIGYGAGTRELPIPNLLRLSLGKLDDSAGEFETDTVMVLEANIDDMNPEWYEHIVEDLFQIGALDVYTTPVFMKKGRPGTVLTVLVPSALKHEIARCMLRETTTLGIRWCEMSRMKAQREVQTVETRYGTVPVKISRLGDEVVNLAPEYEECKRLARATAGVTLKTIYQEALCRAVTLVE